jgi:hypothetical protein
MKGGSVPNTCNEVVTPVSHFTSEDRVKIIMLISVAQPISIYAKKKHLSYRKRFQSKGEKNNFSSFLFFYFVEHALFAALA